MTFVSYGDIITQHNHPSSLTQAGIGSVTYASRCHQTCLESSKLMHPIQWTSVYAHTCKPRPNENVSDQPSCFCCWACRLIAFRFTVASSSVCPPLKNTMPGHCTGTVLQSALAYVNDMLCINCKTIWNSQSCRVVTCMTHIQLMLFCSVCTVYIVCTWQELEIGEQLQLTFA